MPNVNDYMSLIQRGVGSGVSSPLTPVAPAQPWEEGVLAMQPQIEDMGPVADQYQSANNEALQRIQGAISEANKPAKATTMEKIAGVLASLANLADMGRKSHRGRQIQNRNIGTMDEFTKMLEGRKTGRKAEQLQALSNTLTGEQIGGQFRGQNLDAALKKIAAKNDKTLKTWMMAKDKEDNDRANELSKMQQEQHAAVLKQINAGSMVNPQLVAEKEAREMFAKDPRIVSLTTLAAEMAKAGDFEGSRRTYTEATILYGQLLQDFFDQQAGVKKPGTNLNLMPSHQVGGEVAPMVPQQPGLLNDLGAILNGGGQGMSFFEPFQKVGQDLSGLRGWIRERAASSRAGQ